MDAARQSDWKMYRERGIGDRSGQGSRPALLIVDVTNGFTDPDAPLGSDLTAQIAAIGKLLAVMLPTNHRRPGLSHR